MLGQTAINRPNGTIRRPADDRSNNNSASSFGLAAKKPSTPGGAGGRGVGSNKTPRQESRHDSLTQLGSPRSFPAPGGAMRRDPKIREAKIPKKNKPVLSLEAGRELPPSANNNNNNNYYYVAAMTTTSPKLFLQPEKEERRTSMSLVSSLYEDDEPLAPPVIKRPAHYDVAAPPQLRRRSHQGTDRERRLEKRQPNNNRSRDEQEKDERVKDLIGVVPSTKTKKPLRPRPPPPKAKPPKKAKIGGSEEHAIEIDDEEASASPSEQQQQPVEEAEGFVAKRRSTRSGPATSTYAVEQGDYQLFQYPFGALERDSISITRADLGRLQEPEFLNDNLVDFHLKLQTTDSKESKLLGEVADLETLKKDVHVFSSHFYTKFHEGRIDKRQQKTKDAAYDRVERWTRSVDIFAKKYVFVPIVENLHWSLAVVCHPSLLARAVDNEEEGGERPCIIFMDSLQMHCAEKVAANLRIYLELEWKSKRNKNSERTQAPSFTTKELPLVKPKVPMQSNGCDCGLFVLRYAEELLQRLLTDQLTVTQPSIKTAFREEEFHKWFSPRTMSQFRKKFAQLLERTRLRHIEALAETETEAQQQSQTPQSPVAATTA